ncbi:MAG: cytochrome c-type biogenesis protein CcmH [Ignavibacteriae bacterium]|nr:cytochrome c-type biogenesis protein CcmH [Ignavibacteriota bacterium]
MKKKSNFPAKQIVRSNPVLITVFIVFGIAIIFYAIYLFQQNLNPQPTSDSSSLTDVNLPLETTIFSIAKRFVCVCGKCGELSLDVCTCPDATKVRDQIRLNLEAGQTPEQVIAFVNDTYGGMKPEVKNN